MSWWDKPIVNVGAELTQEAFDRAIRETYKPPTPQPIITTRGEKDKALAWRKARYCQLRDEGVSRLEAFKRSDLEAVGWFVGPVFAGPKIRASKAVSDE